MNIAEAYQSAAASEFETVLCLDVRLQPYSGGHEVLLTSFESPFVNEEGKPSFDDLPIAVLICCQPWKRSAKDLKSRWLKLLMRYWGWRTRKLNPVVEMMKFQEYVSNGRRFPNDITYKIEGDPPCLSSPSVHRIKAFLMRETNMTEEQFLDRPYALSIADFCTCQELKGEIGAMTPADKALFAAAKKGQVA